MRQDGDVVHGAPTCRGVALGWALHLGMVGSSVRVAHHHMVARELHQNQDTISISK